MINSSDENYVKEETKIILSIKCNTDGARKENSRFNSYDFILRNHNREPIYAQVGHIGTAINMEAKVIYYSNNNLQGHSDDRYRILYP